MVFARCGAAPRLAAAVACATLLSACGAQWDGEQDYYIKFINDTQTAVVLWNYHLSRTDVARLLPGQSASILADINDVPEQMHVEVSSGKQLGCLLINFKSKPDNARLLVSSTEPCDPHISYFN
ncbi:hypothetical protein M6D93_04475 [Jatrophihabitans telluris]|uniref:Uncharacterized protein n=1 Tax=Jatrophihabitans telluris TaxID=2038343 RepID=A0ABY4R1S3_9ACTN|nr:hypothetical protein [Jatrophihabitans telluris]UQX89262.1 hypothetical protein M6D93_04475 [Jatrophihabitans telluris]